MTGRTYYVLEWRLVNAPISYDAKHPVILPRNHYITTLIIKRCHLCLGHSGTERVLTEIRQQFWIIKGRYTVNSLLKSCMVCRRLKATPQNQQMASLPNSRVTPNEPPFSRVGVDYLGLFTVKQACSELKRYGCLFTCLTTRAVHLEVSCTLDTDSFINALHRLIARRGKPSDIRTDNGSNFVGGLRELWQAVGEWNQQQISNHLLQSNIKWVFNPPGASHTGGVWERQIKTVRSMLNGVLTLQTLDNEGLATLFCSVEAVVNGCSITKQVRTQRTLYRWHRTTYYYCAQVHLYLREPSSSRTCSSVSGVKFSSSLMSFWRGV